MSIHSNLDPQRVRELAYALWEAGGRRPGTAIEDWLTAERQLIGECPPTLAATPRAVDDSIKQSFPASDPPASRLPDEPPVNAEAKWEAAAKTKTKERKVGGARTVPPPGPSREGTPRESDPERSHH